MKHNKLNESIEPEKLSEIEKFLSEEDFWFDGVDTTRDYGPEMIIVYNVHGDWKHDHLRMDCLLKDKFDLVLMRTEKSGPDTGDDSAHLNRIYLDRETRDAFQKLFSESVSRELQESEDIVFDETPNINMLDAVCEALPMASPATQDNIARYLEGGYFAESTFESLEDLADLIYNNIEDIAESLSEEDTQDLIDAGYLDEPECEIEIANSSDPQTDILSNDFDYQDPANYPSTVLPFDQVVEGADCETFDGKKGVVIAKGTLGSLIEYDTNHVTEDAGDFKDAPAIAIIPEDLDYTVVYIYGPNGAFVRKIFSKDLEA